MRLAAFVCLGCVALAAPAHSGHDHGPMNKNMDMGNMHMSDQQANGVASKQHCKTPSTACANTVTVAAGPRGHVWLAWVNGKTLYVQQRLQDGKFATPIKVNNQPQTIVNGGEDRPQLAFGSNGAIFAAWTTPMHKHWTCKTQFARSLDRQHFSKPVTINHNHQPMTHCFPSMQADNKGRVYIAWLDWRDHAAADKAGEPYRGMAVYTNWSTDNGEHFQAKDLLIGPQSCECCRIAMALDKKGLPEIAFRTIYPDNIRDHALVTFSASGKPSKPRRFSFDHWQLNGCPESGPAMTRTGDRTHLLWFDKGQLHYRQLRDGQFSKAVAVGRKGGNHPSIAAGGGVLYRVWQRYSGGVMRIESQYSTDQGQHWSAITPIAHTQGASDYPELVSNGTHVWLSWLTHDDGYHLIKLTTGDKAVASR